MPGLFTDDLQYKNKEVWQRQLFQLWLPVPNVHTVVWKNGSSLLKNTFKNPLGRALEEASNILRAQPFPGSKPAG